MKNLKEEKCSKCSEFPFAVRLMKLINDPKEKAKRESYRYKEVMEQWKEARKQLNTFH